MSDDHARFWDSVKRAAARVEHEANLRGFTMAKCEHCNGRGHMNDACIDYDGYGSIYREATPCRKCSHGSVEVPCSREQQAAAIRAEVAKWRAALNAITTPAPGTDGG